MGPGTVWSVPVLSDKMTRAASRLGCSLNVWDEYCLDGDDG